MASIIGRHPDRGDVGGHRPFPDMLDHWLCQPMSASGLPGSRLAAIRAGMMMIFLTFFELMIAAIHHIIVGFALGNLGEIT